MDISEDTRIKIFGEFTYVIEKMKGTQDPAAKLYYFSATYGVIGRVLNTEFSNTLSLIHMILQTTHTAINGRFAAISAGQDVGIKIPKDLFERLEEVTGMLGTAIVSNGDILESLERLAVLSYSTTGNGYYLYDKGILRI